VANLLYLVHRLPYPPNKGDKVRSYHLLRHLQRRHRVFLGTFLDDPQDEAHLPQLRQWCPDLHVERLQPGWRKFASLSGLLRGEALSLAYYRHHGMQDWVKQTAARYPLDASIVFSSTMAPYAWPLLATTPMLLDLVDVDSQKWVQYAEARRGPMAWLYRREGRTLLAHERDCVLQAARAFLVTDKEVALFDTLAPETRGRVEACGNGVDADHYRPDPRCANPFGPDEQAIVFTGAMDYWPNVDAVVWFARSVMPLLADRFPRARFFIVGRNPTTEVRALAGERVRVTGSVDDVRPYLQHAAAVVAPLRVARGIQNKILEAMAMGQPVITVPACAQAVGALPSQGLRSACEPEHMVGELARWLDDPALRADEGRQARQFVEAGYAWEARLSAFDAWLANLPAREAVRV
jgi:sugar transferase (PEP-CTERM/EpsH1 system associated)